MDENMRYQPRWKRLRRARRQRAATARHWLMVNRVLCDSKGHCNKPRTPINVAAARREEEAYNRLHTHGGRARRQAVKANETTVSLFVDFDPSMPVGC